MAAPKQDPVQAERAARRAAWARKIQGHLPKFGSPRTQMAIMVALTGAAGFLASAGLLQLGLRAMWLRYSLSVAVAYLAFLALLGIWMALARRRFLQAEIVPDEPSPVPEAAGGERKRSESSWDVIDVSGLDDGCFVIFLMVAVLIVVFLGVVTVIASAPELLAEVLLDGLLTAGLYHRLRGLDSSHWLESAVRRTWKPFLGVLIIFFICGLVLHGMDPQALSLVDFLKHLGQQRR